MDIEARSIRAKVFLSFGPYCRAARMIFNTELEKIPKNLPPARECILIDAHLGGLDLSELDPVNHIAKNPSYFFRPQLEKVEKALISHTHAFIKKTLGTWNISTLDTDSIEQIHKDPFLFYHAILEQVEESLKSFVDEIVSLDLSQSPINNPGSLQIFKFITKTIFALPLSHDAKMQIQDVPQPFFNAIEELTSTFRKSIFINIIEPWMAVNYRIPLTQVLLIWGIPIDDDTFNALMKRDFFLSKLHSGKTSILEKSMESYSILPKYASTYLEKPPQGFISPLCHAYAYISWMKSLDLDIEYPDYIHALVKKMDESAFQALVNSPQPHMTEQMMESYKLSLLSIRKPEISENGAKWNLFTCSK